MKNGKSTIPSCSAACPAGIDIPRYIRYIRQGDFDAALAVIREKIPFPAVCGHACVHPCEAKCARVQYDQPVAIRLLKRAAIEHSSDSWADDNPKQSPTGKKVAIIGAGPCGLTSAYYLAGMGHAITIYEALPEPGGMLRYGIPEYRLPNNILDREIGRITNRGAEIVTGVSITAPAELLKKGYDVVLATVGAWQGQKIGIAGEQSSRVINGIAFLKDVNTGNRPDIGKYVVIVGGGNTAVDAARASVRLGAQVTMLYRRTMADMPASREEIADALEEGVEIKYLTAPVKISDNLVTCIKMAPGPADESGRPRPVPVQGSEYTMEFDTVIVAVGQKVDTGAINLEINTDGTVKVDSDTLASTTKAIFAAGDAVTGPSSIIKAIAQGRMASVSIDKYLGGTGNIDLAVKTMEQTAIAEEAPRGTLRALAENIPVEQRTGFNLVEIGFDRETAMAEAHRCLSCDAREYKITVDSTTCKGCAYCKEVCSLEVFKIVDDFNTQGYKPAEAVNTDRCVGCLRCLYVCPDFAITINN